MLITTVKSDLSYLTGAMPSSRKASCWNLQLFHSQQLQPWNGFLRGANIGVYNFSIIIRVGVFTIFIICIWVMSFSYHINNGSLTECLASFNVVISCCIGFKGNLHMETSVVCPKCFIQALVLWDADQEACFMEDILDELVSNIVPHSNYVLIFSDEVQTSHYFLHIIFCIIRSQEHIGDECTILEFAHADYPLITWLHLGGCVTWQELNFDVGILFCDVGGRWHCPVSSKM